MGLSCITLKLKAAGLFAAGLLGMKWTSGLWAQLEKSFRFLVQAFDLAVVLDLLIGSATGDYSSTCKLDFQTSNS